jgi:hypothetical protein
MQHTLDPRLLFSRSLAGRPTVQANFKIVEEKPEFPSLGTLLEQLV